MAFFVFETSTCNHASRGLVATAKPLTTLFLCAQRRAYHRHSGNEPPQHIPRRPIMPTMRAVQVARPGGPLELVERPIPEPRPGTVRIKVQACGICHSDVMTT